ncbi:hypothetical protein Tco_1095468 [Tanacetum coccineum]
MKFTYALRFEFVASKNKAEYKALVAGLRIEEQIGPKKREQEGISSFAHITKQVPLEVLKEKSIDEKEIFAIVEEEGHSWITPLLEYLTDGTLLVETKKARVIKIKSRQYAVIGGVLYRKSFLDHGYDASIRSKQNTS